MNSSSHFNNSFSADNIISIDSNTSLSDNIKYIKVYENETFNIDNHDNNDDNDDDNLSQFSGFTYNKDFEDNDDDKLEQNLGSNTLSDLDSELDFMFDYDIIYDSKNNKHINDCNYHFLSEIKSKIMNKIKLNEKDLLDILYSSEATKFEIIQVFNILIV